MADSNSLISVVLDPEKEPVSAYGSAREGGPVFTWILVPLKISLSEDFHHSRIVIWVWYEPSLPVNVAPGTSSASVTAPVIAFRPRPETAQAAGYGLEWRVGPDFDGAVSFAFLLRGRVSAQAALASLRFVPKGHKRKTSEFVLDSTGSEFQCRDLGEGLLGHAVEQRDVPHLYELLFDDIAEGGADPDHGAAPGYATPLDGAEHARSRAGTVALLERGATLPSSEWATRKLHELAKDELLVQASSRDIARALVKKRNVPVDSPDEKGLSPLCKAALFKNEAMVCNLISLGADANYKTPDGDTPLILAARDVKENERVFKESRKRRSQLQRLAALLVGGGADIEYEIPAAKNRLPPKDGGGDSSGGSGGTSGSARSKTVKDLPDGGGGRMGAWLEYERSLGLAPTSLHEDADNRCKPIVYGFNRTEPNGQVNRLSFHKPSIKELLGDPRKYIFEQSRADIRWVHLPANNMRWIEALFSGSFRGTERPAASHILPHHHWLGRMQKADSAGRVRFMSPMCERIGTSLDEFVLFMPFLSWTSRGALEATKPLISRDPKAAQRPISAIPPTGHAGPNPLEHNYRARESLRNLIPAYLNDDHPLHIPRTLDQYYYTSLSQRDLDHRDDQQVVPRFRQKRAAVMAAAAAMPDQGDQNAAEKNYQYDNNGDDDDGDDDADMTIVSDLWLWILTGPDGVPTLYTAFYDIEEYPFITQRVWAAMTSDDLVVTSVYDIAGLVASECAKGYFNKKGLDFLRTYESEIADVANKEANLFEQLRDATHNDKIARQGMMDAATGLVKTVDKIDEAGTKGYGKHRSSVKTCVAGLKDEPTLGNIEQQLRGGKEPATSVLRREAEKTLLGYVLDISSEIGHLDEIKDVLDELNIMRVLCQEQTAVMRDMEKLLAKRWDGTSDDPESTKGKEKVWTWDQWSLPIATVGKTLDQIARMSQRAQWVYEDLNALIDLKQKQSNVMEARFVRRQAEESWNQTEEAGRQGNATMIFTVVTVVFLPLSFMTAFFTLDITEFDRVNDGSLELAYVLKYSFSISLAISIPLILLAMNIDGLKRAWRWFLRSLTPSVPMKREIEGEKAKDRDAISDVGEYSLPPGHV